MANIFDYIQWRDIKIESVEFNEVDNLILSRLAYFPLDNVVCEDEQITIEEAYKRYKNLDNKGRILQEDDINFFPVLANSTRFKNMILTRYVNKIDKEEEKQFSAVTILIPDNTMYVAYRGTDNTIVGWKEDFNMSFSELVPAQTDAVTYLNNIAKQYYNKIRVGGHSKGGNLAVYASAFCKEEIQDRIINVYNNDGPGFCEKVIKSKQYNKILQRVHTYIPQSSIIGRLLNHKENTTILKSTQVGIMQHDLYTWQVLGAEFVKSELTNSSDFIDKTITDWLSSVSVEQRSDFFDILFGILEATNANTLSQIGNKKFTNAKTMIKAYQNLDEDSKKIMIKTLNEFLKMGKGNIENPITSKFMQKNV